ncbi:MAG: hypothetical protein KDI30_02270, partial [Pseudomonadales bacterium]|nr:hypothetical protein [Pseudomonadales bacterium]
LFSCIRFSSMNAKFKNHSIPAGDWFSANPDKAWGEKFFLFYIPYFFGLNAAKQAFGWLNVGTFWHVTQNLALLLPLVFLPLLIKPGVCPDRQWHQRYAFKMVLWIFVFNLAATYFLTEYFFDVLGMVYFFPEVTVYLDSALVGTNSQHVPIGMYFNAPAFFVVYHTLAILFIRRVMTMPVGRFKPLLAVMTVCAVAYLMAFLETKLVATDANSESFYYKDLGVMLKYGSVFYACYFIVSFPMLYRLDEQPDENWSVGRVVIEALASGMMAMFLVDFATHYVGGQLL